MRFDKAMPTIDSERRLVRQMHPDLLLGREICLLLVLATSMLWISRSPFAPAQHEDSWYPTFLHPTCDDLMRLARAWLLPNDSSAPREKLRLDGFPSLHQVLLSIDSSARVTGRPFGTQKRRSQGTENWSTFLSNLKVYGETRPPEPSIVRLIPSDVEAAASVALASASSISTHFDKK
jgi:hypothetical protein